MTKIGFAVFATLALAAAPGFAGGTCIEKPQFEKPVFDKAEREQVIFERNLLVEPVIESMFPDQPVMMKHRRYLQVREQSAFEKPVFEKNCPSTSQRKQVAKSSTGLASAKSTKPTVAKSAPRPAVVPAVKIASNCNCSPQAGSKKQALLR